MMDLSPLPACGERPTREARRVKGSLHMRGEAKGNTVRDGYLSHSAASAMGPCPHRSTTRSVVRTLCVVPSWKRITVSTGMSAVPR